MEGRRPFLLFVRWGVPALLVLVGLVVLVAGSADQNAVDGAALFAGAGIAVLLLNLLFRFGASGDEEREAEEEARRYFDEHGHWPDES
jgi:dienelactone hydrolase